MEPSEYTKLYNREENYWWYVGRRKLINDNLPAEGEGKKLIDIGCGTGITMKELKKKGYKTYGLDFMPQALEFCKKRGLNNLVNASAQETPYPDCTFDYAICLDVLYHKGITDDMKALKELHRIMKPGGRIIITNPAYKSITGSHETAIHTRERYSLQELRTKLNATGFEITKSSYFNTILFPVIYIIRKLDNSINKNRPVESIIKPTNSLSNFVLTKIFFAEINLLKTITPPPLMDYPSYA